MKDSHYIHTKKYRLEIRQVLESEKMEIVLSSKTNNAKVKYIVGTVPDEWIYEEKHLAQRRFRDLHIKPSQSIIRRHKSDVQMELKNQTHQAQYNKKQAQKSDQEINFTVKYWRQQTKGTKVKAVFDPHHQLIHISILQRIKSIRIAQVIIKADSLPSKKRQSLLDLFNDLSQLQLNLNQAKLVLNHELLNSISLQNSVIVPELQEEKENEQEDKKDDEFLEKLAIFKHIFLTQIITQMISNQFGRRRQKQTKEREGWDQVEYRDEELEALRASGYRMYQFRDHPIKRKKKKNKLKNDKEMDSLDEEQQEQEEQDEKEQQRGTSKGKKEKKPKTTLQKMGVKVKGIINNKKNEKEVCNFTFISGYEKSKINKMRYCLHQMTRETDHTQALMDFIRLVFQVVPVEKLMGNPKKVDFSKKKEEGEQNYKKGLMSEFLNHFKVKRDLSSCFSEYTKEYFFHQIINIGLRVLRTPYELAYLRLPFSHIFWSIKLLYHRHKRAIFHHKQKKNEKRVITLYRGCSATEAEIKELKINVGCCIETEGFLSTSLLESVTTKFTKNLHMVIYVPVKNLKGIFDNGFADISTFSFFSLEQEVLINAFNVFKILSFTKANKEQKANVLRLQYGSIKEVEEKVRKSEDLLDKEYLWKVDQNQISLIKKKLEMNEERMSKHWHTKLTNILTPEEAKLQKRKKNLQDRAKEQYQKAVGKLSQWDKELLLNTKHQQARISQIESYGRLLYELGQYRKGCIYLRRRVKQIESDMAVEGIHWRNNQCLIQKQKLLRLLLFLCYHHIGRPGESFEQGQKLLDVYVSINTPQQHTPYCRILYNMCAICSNIVGKTQAGNKYKEKLIRILKKHELKDTQVYKVIIQHEKWVKECEKVAEEKGKKKDKMSRADKKKAKQELKRTKTSRKQQLRQIKRELYNIRIFTHGLYSHQYLYTLCRLLRMMYIWEQWTSLLRQGFRYIQILNQTQHVQLRLHTCAVFSWMLDACERKKQKRRLCIICGHLACFTHCNIHNYKQYQIVLECLEACLRLECYIAGRFVLYQLILSHIKCKLSQLHVNNMMACGYVILLLSVSKQCIVDSFLVWIDKLYEQQEYTHTEGYKKMMKHILDLNTKHKASSKSVYDERKKDHHDAYIIRYVGELVKEGEAGWKQQAWEGRKGELIVWQHPFHHLNINIEYSVSGIYQYLATEHFHHVMQHFLQYKNTSYHLLVKQSAKEYLNSVYTISKLHFNIYHFHYLPQLLQFYSGDKELMSVQVREMNIDVQKDIKMVQHLEEEKKDKTIQAIKLWEKRQKKKGRILNSFVDRKEVKWIKQIHRRYVINKVLVAKLPFKRGSIPAI